MTRAGIRKEVTSGLRHNGQMEIGILGSKSFNNYNVGVDAWSGAMLIVSLRRFVVTSIGTVR